MTNTLKFRLPLYCSQDCESNEQFLFVMKLQIILWKNLQGYEFYFGSCIKCGWLLRETQAYIKLAISQTASTVTYAGHGRGWRMRGWLTTQCRLNVQDTFYSLQSFQHIGNLTLEFKRAPQYDNLHC